MRLEPARDFAPDLTVAALNARYEGAAAEDIMHAALRFYAGGVAIVSSFGAESAVLLNMAATINPHAPVIMIDTMMLFPETLRYQQELGAHLGLTDLRVVRARARAVRDRDPRGALHVADADACCHLRKVAPLRTALEGFVAEVSGRKRYQSGTRAHIPVFEAGAEGRVKVNPLAAWGPDDIARYMADHALPRHPMVSRGYPSIGCVPCTSPVAAGEDPRAGRWRGSAKTECGIHFSSSGQVERTSP